MKIIKDWGVSNIEFALRAMRAPFESFDNSTPTNDIELLKKLVRGGTEHRKVLRMINWNVEMQAPRYWYQELDTYKVGAVCSSSSTMHLIMKRKLTLEDFKYPESEKEHIENTISYLNYLIESKASKQTIKTLLPEGFVQKRFYQFNYETLLTIYRQRKNHELVEWRIFCDYIYNNLPHFAILINSLEEKN